MIGSVTWIQNRSSHDSGTKHLEDSSPPFQSTRKNVLVERSHAANGHTWWGSQEFLLLAVCSQNRRECFTEIVRTDCTGLRMEREDICVTQRAGWGGPIKMASSLADAYREITSRARRCAFTLPLVRNTALTMCVESWESLPWVLGDKRCAFSSLPQLI